MKVPRCEKLQDGWSVSDQGQSRIQENHAHHGCKKKEEGEKTNELAKSCYVLHVVTCREPAGLDQTPEAGRNTKGNINKAL